MANEVPIDTASVKVMRSHDYCHFEVCLSTTMNGLENGPAAVDELRKCAARLADKAVEQYKVAKEHQAKRLGVADEKRYLGMEVAQILQRPEADRTPNEMAKVKIVADAAYWKRRESHYDYQDDWDTDDQDS